MTSCEGHDHGNSSDSRDCAHHWARHARRRGGRLQGIPCTTGKKVIDHFSLQVRGGKKEAIPLTPLSGRLALVADMGLLNGDIRPIANNEPEEGRHMICRVEIDLYAGI